MTLRSFTSQGRWLLLAAACAACSGAGGGQPSAGNAATGSPPAERARAPAAPASRPNGGLCRGGETPIFQCRVGNRQVAVCGGTSAAGRRYAQYRFGSPDRIELAHPSPGTEGKLTWSRHAYSGGGEAQIAFTRDGFDYVVYSRVIRTAFGADGRHEPEDQAGVFVKKGGRRVADRRCTDPPDSAGRVPWVDLEAAADFLEEGKFRPWWHE